MEYSSDRNVYRIFGKTCQSFVNEKTEIIQEEIKKRISIISKEISDLLVV